MARSSQDSLACLSVLEDALLSPRAHDSDELPAQTRLVDIDAPPDAVLKVIELDAIDRLRSWQQSEAPAPPLRRTKKRRHTDPTDRRLQEPQRPQKMAPLDLVRIAQRILPLDSATPSGRCDYDSSVDDVLSAALALGTTGRSELQSHRSEHERQSHRRTGSTTATESSPRSEQLDTHRDQFDTPKAWSKGAVPRPSAPSNLRPDAELAARSFSKGLPACELPGSGRRGSRVPSLPVVADVSPPNAQKLRIDRRLRSEQVPRSAVEMLPALPRRGIDMAR